MTDRPRPLFDSSPPERPGPNFRADRITFESVLTLAVRQSEQAKQVFYESVRANVREVIKASDLEFDDAGKWGKLLKERGRSEYKERRYEIPRSILLLPCCNQENPSVGLDSDHTHIQCSDCKTIVADIAEVEEREDEDDGSEKKGGTPKMVKRKYARLRTLGESSQSHIG